MTDLKFKRLSHGEGLPLPSYATAGASGMDICAANDASISSDGGRCIMDTGFAVEIPEGFELQVRPRSGMAAKQGITVLNTPGTIDSDYRGEIRVILVNTGWTSVAINRGDRIAQIVLAPVTIANPIEVDMLSTTKRDDGGLGSTGMQAITA